MAWVEKHKNTYLVREWVGGKKKTIRTFSNSADAEAEARWYAKTGKLRPITGGELIYRLEQSAGFKKKKPTPKLAAYAYNLIESDPNVGATSRSAYEATIRNHVEGSIIDIPMDRLVDDPALLRKYWANLAPMKDRAAKGSGMKASVHRLLTKVFGQAVQDGVIPTSPMARAGIKRPSKRRAVEVDPLDIDRIEELAAACLNDRDRLMVLVAGYCGLRGGEVGGLRVKDVDAKSCEFNIRQAVKGRGRNKHLGLPKGDKTRLITIPCSLALEVVKFAKKNSADDGRIFHTEDALIGSVETNKVSQAAAKKVGEGPVNFHALRHSTASLLIADGATVLDVCAYMGHSSPTVTLEVYGHLFRDSGQKLADSMEARRTAWRERMKEREV